MVVQVCSVVHKRCSDISGTLKADYTFRCKRYTMTSRWQTNGRGHSRKGEVWSCTRLLLPWELLIPSNFIDICSYVPTDNKSALVQVIAWRREGDKPLREPMLTQFIDAYIISRGQWANTEIYTKITSHVNIYASLDASLEATKLVLIFNTKTSNLVILYDFMY